MYQMKRQEETMYIREVLQTTPEDETVTVEGWVRTKRDSKNTIFLEIGDGSCLRNMQAIIDRDRDIDEDTLERAVTGASVRLMGTLVESPGKGQSVELRCESLEVLGGASPEEYPLQKKRHSFEFLREIAHLRPRTNTIGAVARIRNAMSMAIHSFFQERGFLWIHTPIITCVDAEGAGDMFQVTTLPIDTIAGKSESRTIDYSRDFFGKRAYLTVTGQLQAEAYATAFKNVYTFGPTFRAENSNTARHLSEFWMVEPEMAFCDITDNMDIAEAFLKHILRSVLESCEEDMALFDTWVAKGIIETLQQVIEAEFARITYTEAVDHLTSSGREFEFPVRWGRDLQSEHEKYLTEEVYKKPVIVTDYPMEIKAFYMKLNEDGRTVRGMDVLVPRLGEIIGGSERESDYAKLETRMRSCGLDPAAYRWYLDLRKYGTVPHAGFGLGFERLIQYVTGMQNIRDVIPFPRTPRSAEF
jgi:asparaginyl-tRNA synthetase